jgi:hypothetical protein
MAYNLFHNFHVRQYHQVVQVVLQPEAAFRAKAAFHGKVPPGVVEVARFLFTSSVSADSMLGHVAREHSRLYDLYKPLPWVFLLHPSPFYAQATQLPLRIC